MSALPKLLYLNHVPDYVRQTYGITIHPAAAREWVKKCKRRPSLLYSDMRMDAGQPHKITTAAWVDLFLKQIGMVPKESA